MKPQHASPHADPDLRPRNSPGTPSPGEWAVAGFGAVMAGLAAGALWLLLVLWMPSLHAHTWLAMPLALLLGPLVRAWLIAAPVPAAILAALAMLLACAYLRVLLVAAHLAGSFGMGFMQAWQNAGTAMLVHLAWLATGPAALAVYLASAALAALLAWRMPLRHRVS